MSDVPESMREGRDQVANRYIAGHGIEIGPGNSPIRLHSGISVKHVDMSPKDVLVGVHGFPDDWSAPDIVDDGEVLSSIDDYSLDFVIACHVLEHTQNPLKVLETWFTKLRTGGVLFVAIPDRRHSFDKQRKLTSFEHLLADYRHGPAGSEEEHLHEWITVVNKETDEHAVAAQKSELRKIDYRIHYHVWETNSFIEALVRSNGLVADFDIEYCGFNWMEAIAVLRKRSGAAGRPEPGTEHAIPKNNQASAILSDPTTLRSALARAQADLEVVRAENESRRQNEAVLQGRLTRQEGLITGFRSRIEDIPYMKGEIQRLERVLSQTEEKLGEAARDIADRYAELADVTKAFLQEEIKAQEHEQTADKMLGMVRIAMKKQPWWWRFMPDAWRRGRLARQFASSGLFNTQEYAERFPDVIAAGHDPVRHYLDHGIDEIRAGKR